MLLIPAEREAQRPCCQSLHVPRMYLACAPAITRHLPRTRCSFHACARGATHAPSCSITASRFPGAASLRRVCPEHEMLAKFIHYCSYCNNDTRGSATSCWRGSCGWRAMWLHHVGVTLTTLPVHAAYGTCYHATVVECVAHSLASYRVWSSTLDREAMITAIHDDMMADDGCCNSHPRNSTHIGRLNQLQGIEETEKQPL